MVIAIVPLRSALKITVKVNIGYDVILFVVMLDRAFQTIALTGTNNSVFMDSIMDGAVEMEM